MLLRSLQSRIVALFLTLIVVVQGGAYLLIEAVGTSAAHGVIEDDLRAGARVLERLLDEDARRLLHTARGLASARSVRDATTTTTQREAMRQALREGVRGTAADRALLLTSDGRVIVDSVAGLDARPFPGAELLGPTHTMQRADALALLDDKLYQLAIVPLPGTVPAGWIAVGREIHDAYARDLRGVTGLDLTLLGRHEDRAWALHASTLPEVAHLPLLAETSARQAMVADSGGATMLGEDVVVHSVLLKAVGGATVVAVLQHPLASSLEPFRRLQRQLGWTSLLALVLSIVAGVLLSRSVARPVHELADAAHRIAEGDYSLVPQRPQPREIAELAQAFDRMQQGIASRESRITDLAYSDALTGLANRTLFGQRLAVELDAARARACGVAVLVLDLDHFKYVNDALGHPIGDVLLGEVAGRLRALATHGELVARLGGDEFAMLLPGAGAETAQRMGARILASLEAPFTPAEQVVDVRASVGVAVFPDHGEEPATLLRHADVAMYVAKRSGASCVVFDERHDPHSRERLSQMRDLRTAVEADQLTLFYQPKLALGGGAGHHAEALVRWRHPTRGLVPPVEFIPFAEQTGYIRAITHWVLGHAVAQCVAWHAEGLPINVSVNLSARDVTDAQLADRVAQLLARHACAPHWITLEITESALLDDPGHAVANLQRLHALGCRISIDDFGTGYSSLALLRRLPLTELKIDKSFVRTMTSDADDAAIVRSTIGLAHDMGLCVVAEGVESDDTLEQLRALGCDMAQGYLMSRPVEPRELAAWVRDSTWSRARVDKPLRRVV